MSRDPQKRTRDPSLKTILNVMFNNPDYGSYFNEVMEQFGSTRTVVFDLAIRALAEKHGLEQPPRRMVPVKHDE